MYDCIIIGGGPAGLSAALYTVRAGLSTLVIARDGGTLGSVAHIENYFGFARPVSGDELIAATRSNLARLGCRFADAEVTAVAFSGNAYEVRAGEETFSAPALLLALGRQTARSSVPGLDDYIGMGVSRCAVCDGFFFRGKAVAVLGSGEYALSEARELAPLASSVTLLTNGAPLSPALAASGFPADTRSIASPDVGERLAGIRFSDGGYLPADGLFIAEGSAGAAELAMKLGVPSGPDGIQTAADGATALPGIYAAGDCAGKPYQVSTAVGDGAKAGLAMIAYVRRAK